ncbi:DUF4340 domain-containing protein [Endothiovibrio diazotrophicus]
MTTRSLLNLILLLAVAVLATVAVMEPGKRPPPANPTVTPLKAAAVSRLRIERPDQEPVVLERAGEGWRMTAPRQLPANGVRAAMVSGVAEAESLSRIAEPGALAQYHLDPPRARLTLDDRTLLFGDIDPLHQRRYLLVDGQIHLIADTVYPLLNRDWSYFVDPALLPGEAKIEAIELTDGTTVHHNDQDWRIDPEPAGLSADAAMTLVDAWRFGKALEVNAYSTDEKDEEKEAATVTLTDGTTARFLILQRTPELTLARPDLGIVYRMADDGRALLTLRPAAGEGN